MAQPQEKENPKIVMDRSKVLKALNSVDWMSLSVLGWFLLISLQPEPESSTMFQGRLTDFIFS